MSSQCLFSDSGLIPQERSRAFHRQMSIFVDCMFVFFLGLISRITIFPSLNSVAWLLMDFVILAILSKNPSKFLPILRWNTLLMFWPLLAIASGLWSINSSLSFYHGIQFGLNTLAGMVVATALGLPRFLSILRLFGFIFTLMSLLYDFIDPNITRDIAGFFRGVFMHKNELGMFSTLQLMVCLLLFLQGPSRVFSAICFFVACITLLKSGSGTSLLVSIFMMLVIPIFFVFRRGVFAASQVTSAFLAFTSFILLFLLLNRFDPIEFVLVSLGKDTGLTGRDLIWRIGLDAVESRPIFGHGFLAYWGSSESSASYLRFVLKQDLVALHNVYLEVTVAFGLIGLFLFVISILQQLRRGFIFFLSDNRIISAMPVLFCLWIAIICLSENPIFWNSQLNFIFMAFAAFNVSHSQGFTYYRNAGRTRSEL